MPEDVRLKMPDWLWQKTVEVLWERKKRQCVFIFWKRPLVKQQKDVASNVLVFEVILVADDPMVILELFGLRMAVEQHI